MIKPLDRRWKWAVGAAAVGGLVLVSGIAGYAVHDRAGTQAGISTSASAGQPIVYVGTRALGAVRFAQLAARARAAGLRQHQRLTDAQIRQEVITQWIRQTALLEAAQADGVVVTDSEVRAWLHAQDIARSELFDRNPAAALDFAELMASQGDRTLAQYDSDPQTILGVREALAISDFVNRHVSLTATEQEREAFIQSVVARAIVRYP